ncbi:hypothetical protein CSAL01_09872 [Colletotrichum salicis]|uniref:Uncharacterized protein n=1 Tax=Colletotrichum salicis TaxID=1209931 RepID=A0A135ULL6_9PEZI|nr:hypothetical protein CSAL01_09872 [Colletotrichum salicis]
MPSLKESQKPILARISSHASRPATWLNLFEITGLGSLDAFHLVPITADYLPDDFIAVPASAEVGAIVTITAVAGAQRLDDGPDSYPVIIGYGFQFDFRQHPGTNRENSAHQPSIALRWAKSPKYAPSLFPAPVWEDQNPFTAITLNGRFWVDAQLDGIRDWEWEDSPIFAFEFNFNQSIKKNGPA